MTKAPESSLFYSRSPYKEAFDIEFPNEQLPGEMYKYRCKYCKVLTTDINGLLEVDVHVPATGEIRQKVIVDSEDMSEADLAKRREALAALKVHPRDADANRAALARAGRCYEDALGDKRDYLGSLIAGFENVLERQDPRQAETARDAFLATLDELEGETWL